MPLCTLSYLKSVLNISHSSEDTRLQLFLNAAEQAVKQYCQLNFEHGTYVDYHTGSDTQQITLREIPVTSIISVHLNHTGFFGVLGTESFPDSTQLTEGVDFVLDRAPGGNISKSGIVYRLFTVWPRLSRTRSFGKLSVSPGPSWGNIRVEYTAGYSPIPADLQMAVAMIAQQMRRLSPFGSQPLQSETIGDYSYRLASSVLHSIELGSVRTTLAAYKQIGW